MRVALLSVLTISSVASLGLVASAVLSIDTHAGDARRALFAVKHARHCDEPGAVSSLAAAERASDQHDQLFSAAVCAAYQTGRLDGLKRQLDGLKQ